jgi:DNA repair protein RecN (Recombination protein N)
LELAIAPVLTRIHIRDFAIIDELELEFGAGMSVLTGETGAGKSILIDALGLVLGDRAASDAVREGADRAAITLGLDIRHHAEALQWLAEHDLEASEECLLRRVIARDGRSKAYVNGSPAPLQLVRQLGEMLVDIHGQHEHQSLLRGETQRQVLDARADNRERLARLAARYREWRALSLQLQNLTTHERDDRIDWLRFQVRELRELNLGADELDTLDEEHRRLAHAGRLKEASWAAYLTLYEADEGSLDARVGSTIAELEVLRDLDSKLGEPVDLLMAGREQLREAASELRRYADDLDVDPQRLAWVEARLAEIHGLARKHRVPPTQLPARLAELESELTSLQGSEFDLEQTEARLKEIESDYLSAAKVIHEARAAAAIELGSAVTAAMQGLGMADGRFEITVELSGKGNPSPHGLDRIEFQVSTNPGQPMKPLHTVASGGELSRISLAIQIIAARGLSIPTLIFDEVDSGIGGAVAEIVGRQLRSLGEHRQVLCVTHLPQVAAQAHHHYRVLKRTHGQTTHTRVVALETEPRVEEIARMLGGVELTDKTRAHAREMIGQA